MGSGDVPQDWLGDHPGHARNVEAVERQYNQDFHEDPGRCATVAAEQRLLADGVRLTFAGPTDEWLRYHAITRDANGIFTDSRGQTWFVSKNSAQSDDVTDGASVTFAGSPHHQPGRRHPEAQQVRAG